MTLDADFYIKSRCQLVGTIRVELCADFHIISQGCHLAAHAIVCGLHLSDVGNRLGLTQEALDNLGNLGKEILLKVQSIFHFISIFSFIIFVNIIVRFEKV